MEQAKLFSPQNRVGKYSGHMRANTYSKLILGMYNKRRCVLGVHRFYAVGLRALNLTFWLGAHQMQYGNSPQPTGCLFMNPQVIICQPTSDCGGDILYWDVTFERVRQSARPWDGDGRRDAPLCSHLNLFKWALIVFSATNRANQSEKWGGERLACGARRLSLVKPEALK